MSYKTINIKEIIEMIGRNEIYLPAIQRKFIWKHNQIEKLFDSIMRDYPIGTFLFWFLKGKKNINNYTFYKFLQNYHQKNKYLNDRAPEPELKDEITGILDGQQRLSSMYIALQGTYAYKLPYYHYNSEHAYPIRELYLNLFNVKHENSTGGCVYDFQFLTKEKAKTVDKDHLWFLVKTVLKWDKASSVNRYYREIIGKNKNKTDILEPKQDDIDDILTDLSDKINKQEIINYYEIKEPDLDNILEIFVRVNSGGTILSKSDLLFSTIVANWEDGRGEIENLIESINDKGDGFKFNNDFIMRSCLVLTDSQVLFKVENFKQENIKKIKNNWSKIENAINETVDLLVEFGFSSNTITSQNAVIPIAYYILKKGILNKDTKKDIKYFLIHSLLKKIYGSQGDTILGKMRDILRTQKGGNKYILKKDKFDINEFLKKNITNEKSLKITEDDFNEILDYKKGAYTFMILSLLYPNIKFDKIKFHQDHLHPKGIFNKTGLKKHGISEEKLNDYKELMDGLPNLQLLEGDENKSKNKTPLIDWIDNKINDKKKYKNDNYIPDVNLDFKHFEEFYNKRRKIIKAKLRDILFVIK